MDSELTLARKQTRCSCDVSVISHEAAGGGEKFDFAAGAVPPMRDDATAWKFHVSGRAGRLLPLCLSTCPASQMVLN